MTPTQLTSRTLDPRFFTGLAELETTADGARPHRLPTWVRRQFPDPQLMAMEAQPAGVRLELTTTATAIELVVRASRVAYVGAHRPRGRVDVVVDGTLVVSDELTGGDVTEVDLTTGGMSHREGALHTTSVAGLSPEAKQVTIWLPHNESVEVRELRASAPLEPVTGDTRPRWVHHGSSISQGSNAVAPSETWVAVAARMRSLHLHNLGFGGSSMVDPFMARVIRDLPADVISLKLGINVVNLDAMRLRAFVPAVHGFLDTIRDGHPTTPIVLVSPLCCAIHEDTPGPGAIDPASIGTGQVRFIATGHPEDRAHGRLALGVIREALQALAERRADPHLHHLDGMELFGPEDEARLPPADALHPGPDAHRLIGERFAALAL